MDREPRVFLNKYQLKQSVTIKPAMQEMLKGILNTKELNGLLTTQERVHFMNANKGLTKSNKDRINKVPNQQTLNITVKTNKQQMNNENQSELPTKIDGNSKAFSIT